MAMVAGSGGVNTPLTGPGVAQSRVNTNGANVGGAAAGAGVTPVAGASPSPTKTVAPVKTGKINTGPGSLGTGMPLDESAQVALQQAAAARAAYMHQLRMQSLTTNQEYGNELQDLQTQHPIDESTLNSNYGSRGLGFSSGYNNANQQLQTVYGTNTARLNEAHQDALQSLLTDKQDYLNSYLLNKEAIREAAADRLSAAAGSLGLSAPTMNVKQLNALLNGRK